MAIFLANEDVEQLISMRDCIDGVEQAYRELGMGRAPSLFPRNDFPPACRAYEIFGRAAQAAVTGSLAS